MAATTWCKVSFRQPKRETKSKKAKVAAAPPAPGPAPASRTAKLLALAYEIDDAIRRGEIKDMAETARLAGVTRARMTQIVNLMLLPPAVQEAILLAASRAERSVRRTGSQLEWISEDRGEQRRCDSLTREA